MRQCASWISRGRLQQARSPAAVAARRKHAASNSGLPSPPGAHLQTTQSNPPGQRGVALPSSPPLPNNDSPHCHCRRLITGGGSLPTLPSFPDPAADQRTLVVLFCFLVFFSPPLPVLCVACCQLCVWVPRADTCPHSYLAPLAFLEPAATNPRWRLPPCLMISTSPPSHLAILWIPHNPSP